MVGCKKNWNYIYCKTQKVPIFRNVLTCRTGNVKHTDGLETGRKMDEKMNKKSEKKDLTKK